MSLTQQRDLLERRRERAAQATGRCLIRPLSAHLEDTAGMRDASDEQVLAWLAKRGLVLPPPAPPPGCAWLQRDETECRSGWHARADGSTRQCPVAHYTAERRRLADLLQGCGIPRAFDETREDLPDALLARIDGRRNVEGLPRLREVARAAVDDPAGANTALCGSCGTAKTQVLLAIYFSALRKGIRAQWRSSFELHELARRLASYDDTERRRAHDTRRAWAAAQLLVLDDLGDRKADPRAPCSGLLLDLMAEGAALAWSSNLDEAGLREHGDVLERAVSRLFADRAGVPCRIVSLAGEDQRQHALRTRWRAPAWQDRALGEERNR